MFQKNNPDYYNDAVRDARVNHENIENHSNSKGKLLLILNLLLISGIVGYFIYQNMKIEQNTAVRGVNYTVDIHEDKNMDIISNHDKPSVVEVPKTKDSSSLEKLIENSPKESSDYVQTLGNELTGVKSKKIEASHQNKELENILANMDIEGFGETTNVVKIDNEPKIDTELDIDALASMVNALVSEELSKPSSYEEQLSKVIPID